jgi:hypothetical protein
MPKLPDALEPGASLPSSEAHARTWQVALLVPQPISTVLYLFLIRAEVTEPSFVPVVGLGVLPLVSLGIGLARWRGTHPPRAATSVALAAIAALELAGAALAAAMVGFAIAWRSG